MTWVDPSPLNTDLFDAFTRVNKFFDLTATGFAMHHNQSDTINPSFLDAPHFNLNLLNHVNHTPHKWSANVQKEYSFFTYLV